MSKPYLYKCPYCDSYTPRRVCIWCFAALPVRCKPLADYERPEVLRRIELYGYRHGLDGAQVRNGLNRYVTQMRTNEGGTHNE